MTEPKRDLGGREALMGLICDRMGLEVKPQARDILCQQLMVRAQSLRVPLSPPWLTSYYQCLCEETIVSQQEWDYIAQQLTNGESFFFRDKGQFSVLERHILPELIRRQAAVKKLRICSAGCSTGEEVYSLVILLHELMAETGQDISQWDIKVYGLDLNPASIVHAKAGVYCDWSLRGVNERQQQAYFHKVNKQFHVDPKFKAQVTFYPFNLVSDSFVQRAQEIFSGVAIHDPLENLDLIICRNVFIYFSASAIATVVDKFYQALRPLGYLLTGHAELHGQSLDRFQVKTLPESLLFQRPAAQLSPPLSFLDGEVSQLLAPESLETQVPATGQPAESEDASLQQAETLFKNKAFKPALHQAEKALKQQAQNPQVLSLMAQIHSALNETERALYYCQAAIEADGCFLAPHYLLAKIFTRQGDVAAAKRTLKKIIYLEPNAVVAYLELSQLYRQEGNPKKSDFMRRCAFDIFSQHLAT